MATRLNFSPLQEWLDLVYLINWISYITQHDFNQSPQIWATALFLG